MWVSTSSSRRAPDFGSEYVTFGPWRSARRHDVPRVLAEVWDKLARSLRSFAENPEAAD